MTRQEAVTKAEELKKDKQADQIVQLLTPFWNTQKTVDVAALLAYAYRRLGMYDQCRKICDDAEAALNRPLKIKLQRSWCYVFEHIIEKPTETASANAKDYMKTLNQENGYDFSIVKFVCRDLTRRFKEKGDIEQALFWLGQINPRKLDFKKRYIINEDGEYNSDREKQHSEKFVYYTQIAELIIKSNNVPGYFNTLLSKYSPVAKSNFINVIQSNLAGIEWDSSKKRYLAGMIMIFMEEEHMMGHAVDKTENRLSASDIASFSYCPASFAIKKTILNVDFYLDYDEDTSMHRKYLNDYYERYRQLKNIDQLFANSVINGFVLSGEQRQILTRVFTAKRLGQNVRTGNNYLSTRFTSADIAGSPDMVLEDSNRFAVEEVFTSRIVSSISNPFESDLMKMVSYIVEIGLDFGYLLYWNSKTEYEYNSNKQRSIITGLKIYKIEATQRNKEVYNTCKQGLVSFYNNHKCHLSTINYNKCVACSSIQYCIHKRGERKEVLLPYKANYKAQEPPIALKSRPKTDIESVADDLPF